ncbi:DUF962 domain-containing protein [Aurantiacibacter aquimixticola]|uniref:DUF962 domain-containing protein n=1 Tax=Aurantiacibacter aquimixticola TaxID=1958945 RepID=A0A419RSU6_9SPHN|nr:Mpo1-like protein [Aurantiacibacter aquimixticola]RJY08814.1 DUF962 domain-containing protein [Aurantiacibacter aquimixticola]
MSDIARTLADYGEYHRDHRNVLTHAAGVPMIVLALEVLMARPAFAMPLLGIEATPALIVSALAAFWYLQLDFKMGLLMTVLLAIFYAVGRQIAEVSTLAWLGGGVALFVVGWLFQFVGHHYEGRKPAFLDDLRSFLVGPLFMVAEGLFALGLAPGLRREVKAREAS